MIGSFRDKATEDVFYDRNTARARHLGHVLRKARVVLLAVHTASKLEDLNTPGLKLELLTKDLRGYHSVRVNQVYRVVFRFEAPNAYEVELSDHYRNN